jgi:hypothetical protein
MSVIRPTEASKAAVRYVRFTSIRDSHSFVTNVRLGQSSRPASRCSTGCRGRGGDRLPAGRNGSFARL